MTGVAINREMAFLHSQRKLQSNDGAGHSIPPRTPAGLEVSGHLYSIIAWLVDKRSHTHLQPRGTHERITQATRIAGSTRWYLAVCLESTTWNFSLQP
jgi:hypothetical protein